MLTFVLRNAVSSTSPSSLFSVLKTFQHIREMKKLQGKYEKHAAPFSLSTVHVRGAKIILACGPHTA